MTQVSKKHHFVPIFLQRQWAVSGLMKGFKWNAYSGELVTDDVKGPKGHCYEEGLLYVTHDDYSIDGIETGVYSPLDNDAKAVHQKLLKYGSNNLYC